MLDQISGSDQLTAIEPWLDNTFILPVILGVSLRVAVVILHTGFDLALLIPLLEEAVSPLFSVRVKFILLNQRHIWFFCQRLRVINVLIPVNTEITEVLVVFQVFMHPCGGC